MYCLSIVDCYYGANGSAIVMHDWQVAVVVVGQVIYLYVVVISELLRYVLP